MVVLLIKEVVMSTSKAASGIDEIRGDIDSLKSNIVELTRHVKAETGVRTDVIKKGLLSQVASFKSSGVQQYEKLEGQVKAKPAQSLAIAFAAGIVASYLLGRR
jgi:hypothetical protein